LFDRNPDYSSSGNFITDAGVANLFSSLFSHPTLTKLSLAENLLYQCPMMAELLDHNHVLTHLNLSGMDSDFFFFSSSLLRYIFILLMRFR
jgi:hypothetical protein